MLSISILVVDDESFVAENLKLKLKRLDYPDIEYRVTACSSASQALEEIKHQKFDIIFTDIRMPFFGGLSLIAALRKAGCQSKIWVLSGYDDFDTVRTAFLNGADDYLLKPIEIGQLDQKLQAYTVQQKPRGKSEQSSNVPAKDTIEYAEQYIQEHYFNSGLSMAEVAESVALSYSRFSALFREKTQMTFPAYLLRFRIQKAIELLREPGMKINDICYKVGLKYPQQFSRDFKKITGLYPTQYRKKLYEEGETPED